MANATANQMPDARCFLASLGQFGRQVAGKMGQIGLLITAVVVGCAAEDAAHPAADAAAASADGAEVDAAKPADAASPVAVQNGRHLRIDLGQWPIGSDGMTAPVQFSLPKGTLAATITSQAGAGLHVALGRWQSGGGPLLVVPSWLQGPDAPEICTDGCTFRQGARPRQQAAMAPNAPLPVDLVGVNEVRAYAYANGGAAPAGKVSLRVDAVVGAPLAKAKLRLNFCLTGANGITAALAPKVTSIADAVAALREIYAAAAIDVTVSYFDVQGPQFIEVDGEETALSDLFGTGANLPAGVNVFFVQQLQYKGRKGPLNELGVAGGIPGPPLQMGTPQAGVAIALQVSGPGTNYLGVVIAHEVGHFLGLFHTEEAALNGNLPLQDQLPDTAANAYTNLMYWSPNEQSRDLTAQQAAVLRSSPWMEPP